MLLVKTKVAPSKIHGLGLFADEDIAKGTVIWKFNEIIDKKIDPEILNSLPETAREFILTYAYLENGKYILCCDNDQYTNHSETPNVDTISDPSKSIAVKDIKKGEEILEDYRTYDSDFKRKLS